MVRPLPKAVYRGAATISLREVRKKIFHLHFSVVWMDSRSTFVPCTALSLTSAFHVIRDITERKKSILKARYGKQKRIRRTAGEESEEVTGQRNVSSWPFRTACTTIERHHVGATPPRLYSRPTPTNRKATKKWYGQNRTCHTGRASPALQIFLHK